MKTFVIIKPDAIKRGLIGKIISRFEDAGFEIDRIDKRSKNNAWFSQMYDHLHGNRYFGMQDFMLHKPLIGIILEGPGNIIIKVRKMVGHTSSIEAASGTIRGDYGGYPIRFNCVHASDSVEAVTKEATLFFEENYGS